MINNISFKESMGILTLGFRLKQLSDLLQQDGLKLYRHSGIAFEPKWLPVFCYLKEGGPTSVTEIARGLGVSHPGINQVSKEMIAQGLVASYRDVGDKRKRLLALTIHGKSIFNEIEPLLRTIRAVLQEVADQSGDITFLDQLEHLLVEGSLYERFVSRYEAPGYEVTIVPYERSYRRAFAQLNEEWINFYFELEERDRKVLNDPEGFIINRGGEIFFALSDTNQVIGTCALVMHEGGIGELSKMAVASEARGRGVGRRLGEAVISLARDKNLGQLFLETNSILAPAMGLYRNLGFEEQKISNKSSYGRADTYMVLIERD